MIVKRNTLYPIFAPMPEDQPIQYTLEANPYRAALIEYAKGKGQIAFETLPSSESEVLETRHKEVLKRASPSTPLVSFANLSEAEVKAETALVESTLRGESSVGDEDLTRIFALKSLAAPAQPIVLQQFVGGKRLDDLVVATHPSDKSSSFGFHAPAQPVVDPRSVAATQKTASQAEKLRGATKAGQLAASSTPTAKPPASKGGIR